MGHAPPPLGFSQVLILKVVKVLCFDTLLQVLIIMVVSQRDSARDLFAPRRRDGAHYGAVPFECLFSPYHDKTGKTDAQQDETPWLRHWAPDYLHLKGLVASRAQSVDISVELACYTCSA